MSRKARCETGLRQLNAKQAQARVNGYSIRERRNTAGLRQLNAKQAQARVKSPSKARPVRVAALIYLTWAATLRYRPWHRSVNYDLRPLPRFAVFGSATRLTRDSIKGSLGTARR